MKRTGLIRYVATAGALLFLSWGASPLMAEAGPRPATVGQDNPVESSDESIAAGRRTYGQFCRSCHGRNADGEGMASPPGSTPANLIDDEWDHGSTDAEIFAVIKEGVPPDFDMDAWEGRITDDDMWNVINFLRDLASQ